MLCIFTTILESNFLHYGKTELRKIFAFIFCFTSYYGIYFAQRKAGNIPEESIDLNFILAGVIASLPKGKNYY